MPPRTPTPAEVSRQAAQKYRAAFNLAQAITNHGLAACAVTEARTKCRIYDAHFWMCLGLEGIFLLPETLRQGPYSKMASEAHADFVVAQMKMDRAAHQCRLRKAALVRAKAELAAIEAEEAEP